MLETVINILEMEYVKRPAVIPSALKLARRNTSLLGHEDVRTSRR